MNTLFERSILAGVGLLSMTHEKAQGIMDELHHGGEDEKSELKELVDQLVNRGEEERLAFQKLVSTEVKNALSEMGIATKDDLQKLAASRKAQGKKKKTTPKNN